MTATGRAAVSTVPGAVLVLIFGVLERLGVDLAAAEAAAIATITIAIGHELTRRTRQRRATK